MQNQFSPDPVYFCHGIPGSVQDGAYALNGLPANTLHFTPNLLEIEGELIDACLRQFDETIAEAGNAPIHVVGFSIGSMVAVRIASARADRVCKLSLVSAAAPLSLGDFLPRVRTH